MKKHFCHPWLRWWAQKMINGRAVEQAHATDNFFVIVFEYSKTTPTLRDKIAADAGVIILKKKHKYWEELLTDKFREIVLS